MIHRDYHQGEKLQVEGLNEISVLIDRSETAFTEVAINTWKKGLQGPPHSHTGKEQIFYILTGAGTVRAGAESYAVQPGDLVYVPAGTIHQTVGAGEEAVSYLLFNAFLDAGKEGHSSFKDHIEQVRDVRRQQAESQSAQVRGGETGKTSSKAPRLVRIGQAGPLGSGERNGTVLLQPGDTERSLVRWLDWSAGGEVAEPAGEYEHTIFVAAGKGEISVSGETCESAPGTTVFVPRSARFHGRPTEDRFQCLCFSTLVE